VLGGLLLASGWKLGRQQEQPPPDPAAQQPAPVSVSEPAPEPPPSAPDPAQVLEGSLFADGLPLASTELPEGLANATAQACNACHSAVHASWESSAHPLGWQGQRFLQAVADAGQATQCQACHLPLAVQHSSLTREYTGDEASSPQLEANPAWDPSLQREGVTCAACHLREGRIAGPRGSREAPHPTVASPELRSAALCAACHQLSWEGAQLAWYDTYGEWHASPYEQAGLRCQDCHMPQVAGAITTGRFTGHASHALALDTARALSVLLELPSGSITRGTAFEFQLRLQNTGAGHAVPTGPPGKVYTLSAAVVDAAGAELHEPLTVELARKLTSEEPFSLLEDTRIPARGELLFSHQATISQKKAAGPALLRVRISAPHEDGPRLERSFPVVIL